MAAVARLPVLGLLVYRSSHRQGRLFVPTQAQQVPGHKGMTATPTAAVVLAVCAQVALIH